MRQRLSRFHGQRSQALIEFALISPVLLLLLFGIIDIGRAVFYYDTLGHAAREGARSAVQASNRLPTNADVLTAVTSQLVGIPDSAPCPQGPISSATPPDNSAPRRTAVSASPVTSTRGNTTAVATSASKTAPVNGASVNTALAH